MRQVPLAAFTPVSDPEAFRESVLECLGCEVFPSAGMVVVRETPGGKVVTRESVHPIAALSSEAALAMEIVGLYDHMKVMAVTDRLTKLFNHREFYQALRKEAEVSGHNFISSFTFPVNLTVSIGIYSSEDGNVSEDQMVSLADEAAYLAKNSGKNRVVVKAVF